MAGARVSTVTVAEASRALGVSPATVWRMIRRAELPSVRQRGRRLIPTSALRTAQLRGRRQDIPPLTREHPIFRLAGAGRSGGRPPGARNKHAILDR